jgi:hypothetical protein
VGRLLDGPGARGAPDARRLPCAARAAAAVRQRRRDRADVPRGPTDWRQGKQAGQLDLDVYPQGDSSFTLYEDDGRSQEYAAGAHAEQRFTMAAPERGPGNVVFTVGALTGSYDGKLSARRYLVHAHTGSSPNAVLLDNRRLPSLGSAAELEQADSGWWYDARARGGVVHVKTQELATSATARLRLHGTSAVGGVHPGDRDAAVDLSAPALVAPGDTAEATATFRNDTAVPVRDVELALVAPETWQVTPIGATSFGLVKPGESVTSSYRVTVPEAAEPGRYRLDAEAAYSARQARLQVTDQASLRVPYASLAAAFDNVAITREDDPAPGDIDGGGSSFIAERLAAEGATPGATISYDGAEFIWPDVEPGTPDNVKAQGQTIALQGRGTHLAFLGTETGFASGPVTVHYADGTTTQDTLGFPNWCCDDPTRYGAQTVFTTFGKNTPEGPAFPTVAYRVFHNDVGIEPGKDVVAVTLPQTAAIHVFAMALKTERLPVVAELPEQVVYADAGPVGVPVEVTNTSASTVQEVTVRLRLPGGMVEPETVHLEQLATGESRTVMFDLSWPDGTSARAVQPDVTVTWLENGEPGEWTMSTELRVTCAADPTRPVAVTYVDSEETAGEDGAGENPIDGDPDTIWHTEWSAADPPHPHEIQLDLGRETSVCGFRYLPRQVGTNGTVADYEIYLSRDGASWGDPVAAGTFPAGSQEKWVPFAETTARYVRFVALSEINGNPWTTAAELSVDARTTH